MASDQSTVDYIADQMHGAGDIKARKMFGEYGLYCDGKFIGVICDNALYLKVTEALKKFAPDLELAPAYEGAKPSLLIPQQKIDDSEVLSKFVRLTHDDLPTKKN